jgi:Protein of unknown function (Hypoth_ymh)
VQRAEEADPRRALSAQRLPQSLLHPKTREDVWSFYHRGKYDTAVFEGMKAVEVSVRDAAGLTAKDIGTNLMRKAFDPEVGQLTDMSTERPSARRVPISSPARSDLTKTHTLIGMLHSMIPTKRQR